MDTSAHKASIDSQGNIILPGAGFTVQNEPLPIQETEVTMNEGVWYQPVAISKKASYAWETVEEESLEEPAQVSAFPEEEKKAENVIRQPSEVWTAIRSKVYNVTNDVVVESSRQYSASIAEGGRLSMDATRSLKSGIRHSWKFLTQPVWVPGKKNKPVEYGRGVLFLLDTVRFGGTFAGIFVFLFVTLNYQSFWSIAQSYVHPLVEVTGMAGGSSFADKNIAEKLKRIPMLASAGEDAGNLIEYLPPVGPPDNRLIIPKLDLNVPIVIPPTEALINENWKQLEADIQDGLSKGVVHYPGTARPGQAGNFFVTGHSSDLPWKPGIYKSVFARLHELKPGDEYWVFYNGDRYRYVIDSKKEIKPADVSVLDQPVNKRMGTLMTCTPVGTALRRLIYTSKEVDPVTGIALEVGEHRKEELPKVNLEMLPI